MKLVRGIGGAVAAGVVLLALVVVGAAVWGQRRGFPGPGGESVAWHIGVAVLVVVAQCFSDRHRGTRAFAASLGVLVAAGFLLNTQWWG
ncbi:hypothetical protein [Nocardia brevicatena]|uniref:hypothetical protein n=1 Tax=Nocardia brevicatena TaxID=37327 RepID=UPI00031AD0AA|nr:hypothetical protein [Nocardia brevicatena]